MVCGAKPASEAVIGRGYTGPSSVFFNNDYWPITQAGFQNDVSISLTVFWQKTLGNLFECTKHSDCWASNIRKIPGWETRDVKFLQCNIQTGTCICKTGYMDADDDRYNGCETKINQGKCPWGSCANHGVSHGQQCGAWKGLICDESSENSCCACDQGNIRWILK